jgi:hypothetical protein
MPETRCNCPEAMCGCQPAPPRDPRHVIFGLGEGNPGALSVMVELINTLFDPDSAFKEMSPIFLMEEYEIRGGDIWRLFVACGRNHITMVAILRAVQLGVYPLADLKKAIENDREGLTTEAYKSLDVVKEKLPNFKWDVGVIVP